jgi:hypothetical protein
VAAHDGGGGGGHHGRRDGVPHDDADRPVQRAGRHGALQRDVARARPHVVPHDHRGGRAALRVDGRGDDQLQRERGAQRLLPRRPRTRTCASRRSTSTS